MIRKRGWVWFGLLQVLFLLFMAASYYSIDYVGKEFKIKTVPVDPRDIFYGDYVSLRYQINEAPLSKWHGDEASLEKGQQTVYVVLEKNKQGIYNIRDVYPNKPDVTKDQIILRAKGEMVWDEPSKNRMELTYSGIERFYVQENTGKKLEQKSGNLVATIRVAPWGSYKLVKLQ